MSIEDIVSIVAHDYDKSFDHAFREKLKLEVVSKRALLIRRDLDKGRIIDPGFINVITADVAIIDESDCWYRTVCPIPKPIRLAEGNTIYSIGSDIFNSYDIIEPMEMEFLRHSKYGKFSSRNKAFYLNGYVYTTSDAIVTVQLIAGDPTKFDTFIQGCSSGASCDYEPDAFITEDMVDPIKRLIGETFPRVDPKDYQVRPNEQN